LPRAVTTQTNQPYRVPMNLPRRTRRENSGYLANRRNAPLNGGDRSGRSRHDAAPSLSIDDVTVNENEGTATPRWTLNGRSDTIKRIDYAMANGNGGAGEYTTGTGTLSSMRRDTQTNHGADHRDRR